MKPTTRGTYERAVRGEGSGRPPLDGQPFQFQDHQRTRACRFKNGQFVMLGLEVDGRPLMRAYSIASPNYAEELEFFSIKVQNGPLTSRLQHLTVGDSILIGRKPTGTLVLDNLRDGRNLYLLATGTGLAPFLATIRDPETYERFATVVLVHGVRTQGGARVSRPDRGRTAEGRLPRRAGRILLALLSDGDARAVPQPGPHPRPHRVGQAVQGPWCCRRSMRYGTA